MINTGSQLPIYRNTQTIRFLVVDAVGHVRSVYVDPEEHFPKTSSICSLAVLSKNQLQLGLLHIL